ATQESETARDEYNRRADRRRQLYLAGWTAAFGIFVLALAVKNAGKIDSGNFLCFFALIAGFIMYCASAIGLIFVERFVKRRLAKEERKRNRPKGERGNSGGQVELGPSS